MTVDNYVPVTQILLMIRDWHGLTNIFPYQIYFYNIFPNVSSYDKLCIIFYIGII